MLFCYKTLPSFLLSPPCLPLCLLYTLPYSFLVYLQDGATALYAASLNGRIEVVRILIEGGADVNIRKRVCHLTILSSVCVCIHACMCVCVCTCVCLVGEGSERIWNKCDKGKGKKCQRCLSASVMNSPSPFVQG